MIDILRRWTCIAMLALVAACSGPPKVRVQSQPETAQVYVNGVFVGNTPRDVVLPFEQGERVFVQVVHEQGRTAVTEILTEESLPATGELTYNLR